MKFLTFLKLTGVLIIAVILQTPIAFADDEAGITFVPSIGYQQKQLNFKQTYNPAAGGGHASFDVTLPTLNVSLTSSYKRIFATLKYETNIADGSASAHETTSSTLTYYLNIPGGITTVDRDDMSFTLGFNAWRGLNMFAGYMRGETKLTPDIGCSWVAGAVVETCDPTQNPNGLSNLAFLQNYLGAGGAYRQKYVEEGPYIGASYAWQIAEAGSLSFSAAYADMNGKYTDNYDPASNLNFIYKGKSTGSSFGLTWTAPLGESSNYFFDIRQQKYNMSADDKTGFFPGNSVKTKETMTGLTAGVQFYF